MLIITTAGYRQLAAEYTASKPVASLLPQLPEGMRRGVCTFCGDSATHFTDMLSLREWGISGTCQSCQDITFGDGIDEYVDEPFGLDGEDLSYFDMR